MDHIQSQVKLVFADRYFFRAPIIFAAVYAVKIIICTKARY